MEKTDKKPSTSTVVFRRFRRVPDIDQVLDPWDYGLIMAIKLQVRIGGLSRLARNLILLYLRWMPSCDKNVAGILPTGGQNHESIDNACCASIELELGNRTVLGNAAARTLWRGSLRNGI